MEMTRDQTVRHRIINLKIKVRGLEGLIKVRDLVVLIEDMAHEAARITRGADLVVLPITRMTEL